MKKKFYILSVLIFIVLLTTSIVYAVSGEYEKTWETDAREQYDPRVVENTRNYLFNDGYLFVDSKGLLKYKDYGDTEISYFSKDGNLILEKKFTTVARVAVSDSHVYIFDYISDIYYDRNTQQMVDNSVYYIEIFDKEFNPINKVMMEKADFDTAAYTQIYMYENEGLDTLTFENENPIFYGTENFINLDVKNGSYSLIKNDEKNLEKYFPLIALKKEDDKKSATVVYNSYAEYNDKLIKVGYYFENADSVESKSLLEIYDNSGLLVKKSHEKYFEFTNVQILNNHIILTGSYKAGDGFASSRSSILVYDFNGELLQVVENNSKHMALRIDKENFLVSRFYVEGTCDFHSGGDVEFWDEESCNTYMYHESYDLVSDTGVKDVITNTTKNPDTVAVSIIGLLIVAGITVYIVRINRKKMSL